MREWYANLAERERRVVTFGAAVAAVLLLLAIVLPLNRNISQSRARITTKQADLAFIQAAMPQLSAAGPGVRPPSPVNHSSYSSMGRRAKAVSANRCRARSPRPTKDCESGSTTWRSTRWSHGSRGFRRVHGYEWNPRKSNPPASPGRECGPGSQGG
jgi:hypothetical protein